MQGYIIRINPSRDEDLIVSLLCEKSIITAYRFYGARHSTINVGYKIDAELIHSPKSSMPQLRNILHLSNNWLHVREKALLWQNFISLFYSHLKGVEEIDEFYFSLLNECEKKMQIQDSKRIQVEAYVKLLAHEGRLHEEKKCFFCGNLIEDKISLIRAFLPAHPECASSVGLDLKQVEYLLKNKSTIFLDDEGVERLWNVMYEGF